LSHDAACHPILHAGCAGSEKSALHDAPTSKKRASRCAGVQKNTLTRCAVGKFAIMHDAFSSQKQAAHLGKREKNKLHFFAIILDSSR